jgi:hypothetical protein
VGTLPHRGALVLRESFGGFDAFGGFLRRVFGWFLFSHGI